MQRKALLAIVLLGIWCVLGSSANSDQIRWKFKKGDRFKISIEQKSTINSNVNRTDISVALEQLSEMSWEVLNVKENGNAVIKQVYTRMKVRVAKTAKPTITYDTGEIRSTWLQGWIEFPADVPSNAENFADVYARLIGIPFQVEMTNRGEIINVVLEKEDMEIVRRIPESMEARQLFEKRGLMKLMNSGGFVLPEKEIETGYQWPVKKQQKMSFGTAEYESLFTYNGTSSDSGIAKFTVKATAKLGDQPKNPLEKPLELKSQKQAGEIAFDAKNGFLKSNLIKQEMETEKPFREMTIKTKSVVENSMKVVKK